MTLHPSPAAGWYTDPNGAPALRYWDGGAWTAATQQAPVAPGYPAAGSADPGYGPTTGTPGFPNAGTHYPAARPGNFFARNRYFAITAAVCAVYAVIALFSNFAFFGILPALYTFQSFRAKEPLAVVALVVTVATIFFSMQHIYG